MRESDKSGGNNPMELPATLPKGEKPTPEDFVDGIDDVIEEQKDVLDRLGE